MNEIIQFPKPRELALGTKLDEYIIQAQNRFDELKEAKLFSEDTEWDAERWAYQGNNGENLVMVNSEAERDAPELINVVKAWLVDYLWQKRLSGSLPQLVSKPYGFRKIIQTTRIKTLKELTQGVYNSFLQGISGLAERTQIGHHNEANQTIRWLQDNHLAIHYIELSRPSPLSTLPSIETKMPGRELVQAILDAKHKVAEAENDSLRWVNDNLAVLAQTFQYGMGLRIGEALRLPVEPLSEYNGKVFFTVWTEKGSQPLARYVAKEWREPFESTVKEIQRITKPYRDRAIELETRGRLSEVEDRLKRFHKSRLNEVEKRNAELDAFLAEKRLEAQALWTDNLRGDIEPDRYYSPEEVTDLLPEAVASKAKSNNQRRKAYSLSFLEFEPTPETKGKAANFVKWHVKGSTIQDVINQHIEFRANNITNSELLEIIHGRKLYRDKSQCKEFQARTAKRGGGGSFRGFTLTNDAEGKRGGGASGCITLDGARELIQLYCEGGFDSSKYIDLKSFHNLFPDLFQSNLSTAMTSKTWLKTDTAKLLRINKQKVPIWTKTQLNRRTNQRYTSTKGYLLEQESIHDYILSRFKSVNLNIESEIYNESLELDEQTNKEITVLIDSKSFSVTQKVSDYLFLSGETDSGGGKPLIPAIVSYYTIHYAFKGGSERETDGLLQRYNVTDDKQLTKEFQTHKGRHWQTTSLFRSGASQEVINKWMGRDVAQGSQYDHRSPQERADKIRELMKENPKRFVGAVAAKLQHLQEQEAPDELQEDFLDSELQVVHHIPSGNCKQDLLMNPCDQSMRCFYGKDGKGCSQYVFDLADEGMGERLRAWVDKEQREVSRLEALKEEGYTAAQMHLNKRIASLKNAQKVISAQQNLQIDTTVIRPFRIEGSDPTDCPSKCGDNNGND